MSKLLFIQYRPFGEVMNGGDQGTKKNLEMLRSTLGEKNVDVYYLHLERGMRNRESEFMNILRSGKMDEYQEALFNLAPYMIKKKDLKEEMKKQGLVATDDRWLTKSVVPFYGLTLAGVLIISAVLNWDVIKGLWN